MIDRKKPKTYEVQFVEKLKVVTSMVELYNQLSFRYRLQIDGKGTLITLTKMCTVTL